jgi:hypothetical protein
MLFRLSRQHSIPEQMAATRISGFDYVLATSVNPWGTTAT